ncbi:alanine racemase [Candidatus Xianfuyuplasma coldseepsis]|uniref:Alanine racemase n=1 Tax=Candidatus Xianfuyuplasma coldseepsis TaxID=2782163 RepID=A0A7L7KTQ5_9MOLU|nr:alanine racemase [Xianfuyuplasma coldseepsis]QMS85168.1 alanine racemase [Xianfuyuplasma coldseepsis]
MNRYRETYAEINLKHLYHNLKSIQKIVHPKTVIPVVKADAYGHGAVEVVRYLIDKGIDYFAVSLLEEALELRRVYPNIELLCMGIIENEGLLIASENNITVTMSNFNQLQNCPKLSKTLKIHLKVDTGMNRLGFKSDHDIKEVIDEIQKNEKFFLEGIFTHFSTADENISYYKKQLNRFDDIFTNLNFKFKMIHVSNSSSQIQFEKDLPWTTHTRLGISLYGLTYIDHIKFLKNTFTLKTKISQLNRLTAGEFVGYGASYESSGQEIIAVLPIGYADGFIRKNTGGFVEINHKRYPIVGRICMDMTFVKVDESVQLHDEVILFGGLISIDEVADRLDTINYEVICQISKRVPRIYKK